MRPSPVAPFNNDERIPALDGLRGIAILLVMQHHFTFYGGMQPIGLIDKLFHTATLAGWCGVDLFFVLSGFLITGILYDAKGGDGYFRNFYIRRCLRIFPLYYGTLIVFFWILPNFVAGGEKYQALLQEQGWYWSYLVNWQIGFNGWPPFYALGHFWSLAIEEQFYLFWPLIVFLFARRQLVMICLAIALCSLGLRVGLRIAGYPLAAYVLTPARMDTLALGALVALVARGPNALQVFSRWAWPVAGVSAVAIAAIMIWERGLGSESLLVQTIGYSLLAVLFAAMLTIAVTSRSHGLGKFLSHPVLTFFGRYSYGLYVFHHPIVVLLRRSGVRVGDLPGIAGSRLPAQMLYVLLVGGISFALAMFSWHLYESRFLKLKTLFPYQHATGGVVVDRYEVNHVRT